MKFLGLKALPMRAAILGLLSIVAFLADAAELRIEALALPYASPWQRATPQQEAEDDALFLDAPDAGLHLVVPRQTRLLKMDADAYYAKLRENWQKLYGSDAKISWFESGDTRSKQKWLACRRPSRDSGVSVFHLSTVFAGRAYSVLLFAPAGTEALPKAALDLLAGIRVGSEPAPVAAQAAWAKTHTIYPKANAEVLDALVQSDVARLGDDGMVTGFGLDFSADPAQPGVVWFIEGYQWKTIDARVTRMDWNQGGRLEMRLSSESAQPVQATAQLALHAGDADISAQLRVWDLCAASTRMADVLAQLQRGAFAQIPRLAQERASGCPEMHAPATPAVLRGESGKTVQLEVALPLPPAPGPAELAALHKTGLTRIALIEVALSAGSARTGFGDRLIERARWYVVFEMGEAGLKP